MINYPKITIVTPNFNGAKYLERTIDSVVGQNYPNLEYIVMDGGSTDGSVDIIRKYAKYLAHWESKPDNGLYDALNQGFRKSSGEIMGWINSDDLLMTRSLFSLADIFSVHESIRWIQGYPAVTDEDDRIVYHRPAVGPKIFFYLKDYHNGSFIQQESTFWKRSLWEDAGKFIATEYRYAGDFELWMRFFNHARLYITDALLGAFRLRRDGQISTSNYKSYLEECDRIVGLGYARLPLQEQELIREMQQCRNSGSAAPCIHPLSPEENAAAEIAAPLPRVIFDFSNYRFTMNS
jgi:glycosyltransferase involved in cell wall biosynthesis